MALPNDPTKCLNDRETLLLTMPSQEAVDADSGCLNTRVFSLYTRYRPDFESAGHPRVRPGYCADPLQLSDELCVPCTRWTALPTPSPTPSPTTLSAPSTAQPTQDTDGVGTTTTTTACKDIAGGTDPTGWTDVDGVTCDKYVNDHYCTKGGKYGAGWKQRWGTATGFADADGIDAFRACCGCGGGSIPIVPQCGNLDGWVDKDGLTCDDYAAGRYCTPDGKLGGGWLPEWGVSLAVFAANASDSPFRGVDASQACCACGFTGTSTGLIAPTTAGGRAKFVTLDPDAASLTLPPDFEPGGDQLIHLHSQSSTRPTTVAPVRGVPHSIPWTTAASSTDVVPTKSTPTATIIHIIVALLVIAVMLVVGVMLGVTRYCRRVQGQRSHRSGSYEQDNIPLEAIHRDLPLAVETIEVCEQSVDDSAGPPQPARSTFLDYLGPQHRMQFTTLPNELERDQLAGIVRLDSGQFGTVYKALFDPQAPGCLPFTVAVKVARRELDGSLAPQRQQDFLREALITAQFNHPNIIGLFGVVVSADPGCLLVLQYCEKGSLLKVLRTRTEWTDTMVTTLLRYSLGIARGMEEIASRSIVHRDLACRNVLVDPMDCPKVADLGLSRETRPSAKDLASSELEYYRTVDVAGMLPIPWLAPEALQESLYTESTDLWSFAITLVEIFTNGVQPHSELTFQEIVFKVCDGYVIPKPAKCPDELYERVIKPCLAFSGRERPRFGQVVTELEAITNKLPDSSVEVDFVQQDDDIWGPRLLWLILSHPTASPC